MNSFLWNFVHISTEHLNSIKGDTSPEGRVLALQRALICCLTLLNGLPLPEFKALSSYLLVEFDPLVGAGLSAGKFKLTDNIVVVLGKNQDGTPGLFISEKDATQIAQLSLRKSS